MARRDYETLDELHDALDAAGISVSNSKLKRWRKWKLVPTPERVGLGYGQGTEARYPAGTADMVIALQRFLDEKRSKEYVGWSLWLAGHDVSVFIREEITTYVEMVETWKQAEFDETGQFSLDGLTLRAVRRVAQGTFLSTLEKLIVDLVSGTYREDWLSLEDDRDFIRNLRSNPEELKRFDRDVDERGRGEDPLEFASNLAVLSEGFGTPAIRQTLEDVSEDQFRRMQEEAIAARKLAERFLRHPIDPVLTIGRLMPSWLALRWGDSGMSQVLNVEKGAHRRLAEVIITLYQELGR